MTLDDIAVEATARHRFRAVLVLTFAGLALLLAHGWRVRRHRLLRAAAPARVRRSHCARRDDESGAWSGARQRRAT